MEKKKSCMIIGAAPHTKLSFLDPELCAKCFIIAADGGYLTALSENIKPNAFIGDMDSASFCPQDQIPCTILPCEKDWGDVHTAVEHALKDGIRDFYLVGCSGGRADHYLANLYLLERIAAAGGRAVLMDEQNEVRFLNSGEMTISKNPRFHYLSVLPLDESVTGVSLTGLKYPLCDATLKRFEPIGISNEWTEHEATIRIKSGKALIILSGDEVK